MHHYNEPIGQLPALAKLYGIDFRDNAVAIQSVGKPGRNSGIVAQHKFDTTNDERSEPIVLMTVPQNLVLSLDNVWIHSKADTELRHVLEAVGDYGMTARGAILIFLLIQLTHNSTEGRVGVAGFFSQYIKFIPFDISLPTFWSAAERGSLRGTSLEAALSSKVNSLQKEFSLLRDKTSGISWCNDIWWNTDTGTCTFEDWLLVDAMYRSRALDLPGTGHSMVPCIDMANHASGSDTVALYETDSEGNAVLLLRDGQEPKLGDEVTITYGDDKGACEMLFSYGFLEEGMDHAKELFLQLEIPDDDPLKLAKKAVSECAPGFRLYLKGDSIAWEGPYIWLLCINEEDGLQFQVLQNIEGGNELQAFWNGEEIQDLTGFQDRLEADPMKDLFSLRAVSIFQSRVEEQLLQMQASQDLIRTLDVEANSTLQNIVRLRDLEETLMLHAYEEFEDQKNQLAESTAVRRYLNSSADLSVERGSEDDFS